MPMTTFRPIASRTKTPAFANASYQVPGVCTMDSGGNEGRKYIRIVIRAMTATIAIDRWRPRLSRRTPNGEEPLAGLAGRAVAVMLGLPSPGRRDRTA